MQEVNNSSKNCLPFISQDKNKVAESTVENHQNYTNDTYDEDYNSNAKSLSGDDFNYSDYISDDNDAVAAATAVDNDNDDDVLEIKHLPPKSNWSEAEIARTRETYILQNLNYLIISGPSSG